MISILLGGDMLSKYAFYDMRRGENLFFLEPVFNRGISRGIQVWLPLVLAVAVLGV